MTTTTRPRRRVLAAGLTATCLTLAACGATPSDQTEQNRSVSAGVLDRYGLGDMDARGVIERLDEMPVADRPATLMASIQPTELVLTDTAGGSVATLPMPTEEFYLAVAPYEDETHDCLFHSLTTCLGEMAGEDVDITVSDEAGQTILDETRTTYDNGFVGLWLPRNLTGTITVEQDGRTATVPITTGDDDLTCLTTAQLT